MPTTQNALWSAQVRGFVFGPSDRALPASAVRQWVDSSVEAAGRNLGTMAQKLSTGELTINEFIEQSQGLLAGLHISMSALAVGGFQQIDDEELLRINERLDFQFEHLAEFAKALADEELSDAQALVRAELYAGAGIASYENSARALAMGAESVDEEMLELDPSSDSCDDCLQDANEWVPIGTLPDIGERKCMFSCNCKFLYRDSSKVSDDEEGSVEMSEVAVGEKHSVTGYRYSSSQFNFPLDLHHMIQDISQLIPDEYLDGDGRETNSHITIKYGLHDGSPSNLRKQLLGEPPIHAQFGRLQVFRPPDGPAVVVLGIVSAGLHALNSKLTQNLATTQTQQSYVPHATLAYVKPEFADKYDGHSVSLTGKTFTVDHVYFRGKDGRAAKFPLKDTHR